MCLVFEVTFGAAANGVRSTPRGLERIFRRRARTHRAYLLDLHGCDLLTDDAHWDASTWDMTEVGRRKLAAALGEVRDAEPGSWGFTALWHGDKIAHEVKVPASELINLVEANRLGNFTRYVVTDHLA